MITSCIFYEQPNPTFLNPLTASIPLADMTSNPECVINGINECQYSRRLLPPLTLDQQQLILINTQNLVYVYVFSGFNASSQVILEIDYQIEYMPVSSALAIIDTKYPAFAPATQQFFNLLNRHFSGSLSKLTLE
jgi:hypothetical protein